jgi:hypothetical protein
MCSVTNYKIAVSLLVELCVTQLKTSVVAANNGRIFYLLIYYYFFAH